mgnify:CR=1 FL=1|jgi:hypothetical protein
MNKTIDLQFGEQHENHVKQLLEHHFGDLHKTTKYHAFDFINDKYVIEVKTRRIRHNQYKTQIFGENKLRAGAKYLQEGKQPIFVFNCTDGVFCWYQSKDDIVQTAMGGRSDRGKQERHSQAHIAVSHLTLLKPKI